jgi:hypothetical protein
MKLVEVVLLVGSQCVSPVQHMPNVTEASKVPCAVMILRDTDANSIDVLPAAGVNHPEVRLALGFPVDAAKSGVDQAGSAPVATAVNRPQVAELAPMTLLRARKQRETVIAVERPPEEPPEEVRPASSMPDMPSAEQPEDAQASSEVIDPVPDVPKKAKPSKPKRVASAATAAEKNYKDVCGPVTKARWYTNKQGRRKYRCVRPGKKRLY